MKEGSAKLDSPLRSPQEIVYADRYQQLYKVTADFGAFTKEYVVRDSGQRAGVVALRHGDVLLVRQYRLLIDGLSWEIPGGKVEDGESPATAAARECFEEAGVRCQELKPLLSYHPGLDVLHNPTFLFFSENVIETKRMEFNVREVVQREWVPLDRCLDMVFNGDIQDSFSIIALLTYAMHKARLVA